MLKKSVPFICDEIVDQYFYALKHTLTHAPLLHPPNYHWDYFLYLAASNSTIGMVLVQEDESRNENVIYNLSQNLNRTEINIHMWRNWPWQ